MKKTEQVYWCDQDLWTSTETTTCKECGQDMKNIGFFEFINLEEVQNEGS